MIASLIDKNMPAPIEIVRSSTMTLNILLPVYNEEKRLRRGVEITQKYLAQKADFEYQLTIVDNASSDKTQQIAEQLCSEFEGIVHYIRIAEKGVGAAFRAGVAKNTCDIVGYMDIDLATDIKHIPEMMQIFQNNPQADMVNASRWNKKSDTSGRKFYRNITSIGLVTILKLVFHMKASDAICGFKFFRKEALEKLMTYAEPQNGWFYLIELLIRAEKHSFNVVELPVKWEDDAKNTTVKTGALIKEYLRQIVALKKRMNMK